MYRKEYINLKIVEMNEKDGKSVKEFFPNEPYNQGAPKLPEGTNFTAEDYRNRGTNLSLDRYVEESRKERREKYRRLAEERRKKRESESE